MIKQKKRKKMFINVSKIILKHRSENFFFNSHHVQHSLGCFKLFLSHKMLSRFIKDNWFLKNFKKDSMLLMCERLFEKMESISKWQRDSWVWYFGQCYSMWVTEIGVRHESRIGVCCLLRRYARVRREWPVRIRVRITSSLLERGLGVFKDWMEFWMAFNLLEVGI